MFCGFWLCRLTCLQVIDFEGDAADREFGDVKVDVGRWAVGCCRRAGDCRGATGVGAIGC